MIYDGVSAEETVVEVETLGNSVFRVDGIFSKIISGGRVFNWTQMSNSSFNCVGEYSLDYSSNGQFDFKLKENSSYQVFENAIITNSGGEVNSLDFIVDATLDFKKNLVLNNSIGASGISIFLNSNNSKLFVTGDLKIDANQVGKVGIYLSKTANMFFGGYLDRVGGMGILNMASTATFNYTGSGQQIIDPVGVGPDAFSFSE